MSFHEDLYREGEYEDFLCRIRKELDVLFEEERDERMYER